MTIFINRNSRSGFYSVGYNSFLDYMQIESCIKYKKDAMERAKYWAKLYECEVESRVRINLF